MGEAVNSKVVNFLEKRSKEQVSTCSSEQAFSWLGKTRSLKNTSLQTFCILSYCGL